MNLKTLPERKDRPISQTFQDKIIISSAPLDVLKALQDMKERSANVKSGVEVALSQLSSFSTSKSDSARTFVN